MKPALQIVARFLFGTPKPSGVPEVAFRLSDPVSAEHHPWISFIR